MAVATRKIETNYSHLTPLELLRNNIETQRLEVIPLADVITDQALIDDTHAKELGDSMAQKRGQITPIAVRTREEDGKIIYDVIDGFHRSAGKKRRGDSEINATVIYGCPDEEMYDLRILAASSVRSVQFPRIAEWITKSFESTFWAQKGLTVVQAFSLAVSDRERSYLKISNEELAELKTWAKEKCGKWQKSVTATLGLLRVVASADPELVRQVRTSGGGRDTGSRITPDRLRIVATKFPREECYAAQRAILQYIIENRYYAEEAAVLVERAAPLIQPGMSQEIVYQIVSKIKVR